MNDIKIYVKWSERITPIIIFLAGVAAVLLIISWLYSFAVSKKIDSSNEKNFKSFSYYFLDTIYTVCVTIISLFPLLGMLGTVLALLGLDISSETESLKSNFFQALDTTMWGLIFSVIGKFLNSLVQPFIEAQLEKAKNLLKKSY